MQLNLAAIDDRKEVAADEREKRAAQRQNDDRGQRHDHAAGQQRMQNFRVAVAHGFEAMLELGEQARKPAV